jgi:hypothetical protein
MEPNPKVVRAALMPRLYRDASPSPEPSDDDGSSSSSRAGAPPPDADPPRVCAAHWAFRRTPCVCPDFAWLCVGCGGGAGGGAGASNRLHAADMQYARGWDWRRTYGRLHAGAAEGGGAQGVECGRGRFCRGARIVEKEVEYISVDDDDGGDHAAAQPGGPLAGAGRTGGSFGVQETQGVGGRVYRKARIVQQVGGPVDEGDGDDVPPTGDEQHAGGAGTGGGGCALLREHRGEARSWCAWCERIIVSAADEWRVEWSMGGYS